MARAAIRSGGNDHYLFKGGGILTTVAQFTDFDSYSHGQGAQDLLITPSRLALYRATSSMPGRAAAPSRRCRKTTSSPANTGTAGTISKLGGDFVHRDYQGTSVYHPVQLLRADNSLAEEIDFGPAGQPHHRRHRTRRLCRGPLDF